MTAPVQQQHGREAENGPGEEADFIIVGAGAAGCVLANRLTADGRFNVLLVEAGGSERHPLVAVPAGFFHLLNHPGFGWGYKTAPEDTLGGRQVAFPRGRVLGGSGSINGMWHSWGLPCDYDGWAASGAAGWGFADIRRYLEMSETYLDGAQPGRGRNGPIHVSQFADHQPLTREFAQAAQAMQLPFIEDYNANPGEGVAFVQQNRRGRFRVSSASAYLRPAMRRPNLRVLTGVQVLGVELSQGRATGIRMRHSGQIVVARARQEVILAAGAINSPHLLQVSGIGDGAMLQRAGIEVKHDLPGVGQNLHDHFVARVVRDVPGQLTLNQVSRGWRLMREMLRYGVQAKGILTYSAGNATAFVRSNPACAQPDLQLVFTPASYSQKVAGQLDTRPAISCGAWQMRPASRGTLRVVSPDPLQAPQFNFEYLKEPADQQAVVAGLQWCRRILQGMGGAGSETSPGRAIADEAALLEYARSTGSTVFHPVGSCRMGQDDMAVVGADLKVHRLARLRVVDASVMPQVTSSNTHAPTVMIAEKAADMILHSAIKG